MLCCNLILSLIKKKTPLDKRIIRFISNISIFQLSQYVGINMMSSVQYVVFFFYQPLGPEWKLQLPFKVILVFWLQSMDALVVMSNLYLLKCTTYQSIFPCIKRCDLRKKQCNLFATSLQCQFHIIAKQKVSVSL